MRNSPLLLAVFSASALLAQTPAAPTAPIAPAARQARSEAQVRQMQAARALYYTPTVDGYSGFSCKVDFAWKSFLESASGKALEDDNPLLKQMAAVKINIDNQLSGKATTTIVMPDQMDEILQAPVKQMTSGLRQMFEGVFQMWNPNLSGKVLPDPTSDYTMESKDGGYFIKQLDPSVKGEVELTLDKDFHITRSYLKNTETEVDMASSYQQTPRGLIPSKMDAVLHQSLNAPPMHLIVDFQYQDGDGLKLPGTIQIELVNTAKFHYELKNCTVSKRQP